ncbi:MAG: hypothetical protein HQL20_04920 [Candidatus Omnitrophica bacterium]|nr:hypothetical protein [Candidatus Omnitrophota bacterium]
MTKSCLDRKLIGEILVERGLITQRDLDLALEHQKTCPGSFLGEILIRLGVLSEIDIVTALVVQCNLPYIAVSKHIVDAEVVRLIPAEMARRERVVPLDRIGTVLSIVMAGPLNDAFRHKVEEVTGCKIAMFITTPTEIDNALNRFYPENNAGPGL